jgi:hypothetical protein
MHRKFIKRNTYQSTPPRLATCVPLLAWLPFARLHNQRQQPHKHRHKRVLFGARVRGVVRTAGMFGCVPREFVKVTVERPLE